MTVTSRGEARIRNMSKKTLGRGSDDRQGFTLIELLIVVGIIVALATVTVPLVVQFADKGDEGVNAAEAATVQTAVREVMVTNKAPTVTARAVAAVVDGADDPTGVGDPMSNYIRDLPTVCSYTWLDSGAVTQDSCP